MLWAFFGAWMVIVKDNSGAIVYRENVDSERKVVQLVGEYLGKGYEVEVKKDGSGDVRPMAFVEGNTNVVTSINAGSGINVDNTDPANPVVSLPSCSDNQLLMMSNGNWTCVDKASVAGSAGDYTQVTMLSQKYGPAKYSEALIYCADLDSLGYDDWRLPSFSELAYMCRRLNKCKDGDQYLIYNVSSYAATTTTNYLSVLDYASSNDVYYPLQIDYNRTYPFYCVR